MKEKSEEEKVEVWLNWMRACIKERNVVPPRWLRIEFGERYESSTRSMHNHEASLNEAYARLLKETAAFRDEEHELMESKKQLAEHLSTTGRRKIRRRHRHLQGVV